MLLLILNGFLLTTSQSLQRKRLSKIAQIHPTATRRTSAVELGKFHPLRESLNAKSAAAKETCAIDIRKVRMEPLYRRQKLSQVKTGQNKLNKNKCAFLDNQSSYSIHISHYETHFLKKFSRIKQVRF